jgi:hypothetical protein
MVLVDAKTLDTPVLTPRIERILQQQSRECIPEVQHTVLSVWSLKGSMAEFELGTVATLGQGHLPALPRNQHAQMSV